jgi:hypothetical protein
MDHERSAPDAFAEGSVRGGHGAERTCREPMMRHGSLTRSAASTLALLASLAGCVAPQPAVTMCVTRANCPGGLDCIGGVCGTGLEPDAGSDAAEGPDAGPSDPFAACSRGGDCDPIVPAAVDRVDLLLMIDNSASMAEEQSSLITEIPRMLRVLASGDRDADGAQDFRPIRSIHVGVVSSDMGLGSVTGIDSCDAGFGDDGILSSRGADAAGCLPAYPSGIFDFLDGRDDPTAFATAVGCVTSIGTDGCGFEHQLEAPLKAISLVPQSDGYSPVTWTRAGYRPPVFHGSTFGHGGAGGANEGFLRPGSVLAILLVTDEDDCSAIDPSIFDRSDPRYSAVDLSLRCHTFPEQVYPVQRYVDGFAGLRSRASYLVFGAIVGVPQSAIDEGLSYDDMLALDEMTERIDPVALNHLLPACTSPAGRGSALPARRIVSVAQGLARLGASTSIHSVCNTSYAGAVDGIVAQVARSFEDACYPRALAVDAEGDVPCALYEILPEIGGPADRQHCADLASPEAYALATVQVTTTPERETRREVCLVRQVGSAGAGVTPGWFYDDGSLAASTLVEGCAQHIALSVVDQVEGSELVLVCAP